MVSDVFKALADPTRRAILDELTERDGQTLFELCARLTMKHGLSSSRQAISQHLDVLEAAGLVSTRREGRYKFHHLDTAPLRDIADRWPITAKEETMRINLTSVLVDDQEKALRFYTDVLGFVKKTDVPLGEHALADRRLARRPGRRGAAPGAGRAPGGGPFKEALVADGIPFTSFAVDDVQAEYERLRGLGVVFTQEPATMGPVTTAVFDDTCGNLIQITPRAEARLVTSTTASTPARPFSIWPSMSSSSLTRVRRRRRPRNAELGPIAGAQQQSLSYFSRFVRGTASGVADRAAPTTRLGAGSCPHQCSTCRCPSTGTSRVRTTNRATPAATASTGCTSGAARPDGEYGRPSGPAGELFDE